MTGVVQVSCGQACAGLKPDGSVVTWGDSGNGGDTEGKDMSDFAQFVCGYFACAGVKTDGSVVALGDPNKGGSTQGKDVSDMAQVACGKDACAG